MENVKRLISDLRDSLQPWRAYLIAIEGRDGVGKSPLGRRLAWKLDVPLVETDLYLAESQSIPNYHLGELKRVIQSRIGLDRPVIVEGVFIRKLLANLDLRPDYVVHVSRLGFHGSHTWSAAFSTYESEYPPSKANWQVVWPERSEA